MKRLINCVIWATALLPVFAVAANPSDLVNNGIGKTGLSGGVTPGQLIQNITNTIIFLVGSISIIMMIIGGLRLVLSQGDPGNIKSARETILYAAVGLVVAVAAFAIAQFVVHCTSGKCP